MHTSILAYYSYSMGQEISRKQIKNVSQPSSQCYRCRKISMSIPREKQGTGLKVWNFSYMTCLVDSTQFAKRHPQKTVGYDERIMSDLHAGDIFFFPVFLILLISSPRCWQKYLPLFLEIVSRLMVYSALCFPSPNEYLLIGDLPILTKVQSLSIKF